MASATRGISFLHEEVALRLVAATVNLLLAEILCRLLSIFMLRLFGVQGKVVVVIRKEQYLHIGLL